MENQPQGGGRASKNNTGNGDNADQRLTFDYPKYESWYADTEKYEAAEAKFWFRQNIIGGIGVAVSALALAAAIVAGVIAYNAYIAALNAVAEAKRQADAAEDQVNVAKDTEKRQLRAYIGVVSPPDNQRINPFFLPIVPIVRLNARNFGQTPAYKVTYVARLDIRDHPLPKDTDYTVEAIEGFNPVTIFPGVFDMGEIKLVAKRPLNATEIASIQGGKTKRLYAWGTVNYRDVFDAPHYTEFCIGFFNLTITDIQFEPCDEHSGSD
jgi:hypothetical protein